MVKPIKKSSEAKLEKQFQNLEIEIARFRVNLAKTIDKQKLYSDLSVVIGAFKKLNNNIENPKKLPAKEKTKAAKPKLKSLKSAKGGIKRLLKNIDKDL
ncbi:MAG: hypothetical protein V1859_06625 [archaeon]